MSFASYLKEKQPLVYQTFLNARNNNTLAQAYLIKGEYGAPVLEIAKYLAKSLICEKEDVFACEECSTCRRFDEGNYTDFVLLDAQKESLKVQDIENLEMKFSTTSMERSGKMIYIIHHVENMNRESINALLKFLEEPQEDIYAFLTTENETKVLPTILSRCQHLKIISSSKEDQYHQIEDMGLKNEDYDLLSNYASNPITLKEMMESESYKDVSEILIEYIKALTISLDEGYYYMQKNGITKIKSKEEARLFIDMLASIFKEMLRLSYDFKSEMKAFSEQIKTISSKIKNVESCYKEIMFTRGRIELNVTISLILEHLAYFIAKGGEEK